MQPAEKGTACLPGCDFYAIRGINEKKETAGWLKQPRLISVAFVSMVIRHRKTEKAAAREATAFSESTVRSVVSVNDFKNIQNFLLLFVGIS